MKLVSIIGGSEISKLSDEYNFAYQLGKLLGKRGYGIVCGGRTGVMEAVCKGAKEVDGLTIGIMPSVDGSEANNYVDIKINTGLGHIRNPIVVASGSIVVAIGGNYGTLSEIAYAMIFGKIVLGYKTHDINGLINIESPDDVIKFLE